MTSNSDCSTDGRTSHRNSEIKGSVYRVGSRSLPKYPLVVVCLGLLNSVLLLIAVVLGINCGSVSKVSFSAQITSEALIIEVNHLQIMHTEAIKIQKEAQLELKKEIGSNQKIKVQLEQNKTRCDHLQRQLEMLLVEKATLQSDSSDALDSCGRCMPGWFLLNTSCYYHGNSNLKNWSDSRADCISRGADLAVIDNWEEQVNLFEYLPKQEQTWHLYMTGGIWIGLTDIQTEGTWVWVNNVTLLDKGYWMNEEPNNYGLLGEDCGALVNKGPSMLTWVDANCQLKKEWLCERESN